MGGREEGGGGGNGDAGGAHTAGKCIVAKYYVCAGHAHVNEKTATLRRA